MRSGSLVRRRQLARTLRELRVRAGMTIEAAAPLLDFSPAKLSRIENAQQGVDVHVVRSMLDLFDVGGEQWGKLLELTREASVKGWWRAYGLDDQGYVPLEASASRISATSSTPWVRCISRRPSMSRELGWCSTTCVRWRSARPSPSH